MNNKYICTYFIFLAFVFKRTILFQFLHFSYIYNQCFCFHVYVKHGIFNLYIIWLKWYKYVLHFYCTMQDDHTDKLRFETLFYMYIHIYILNFIFKLISLPEPKAATANFIFIPPLSFVIRRPSWVLFLIFHIIINFSKTTCSKI